MSEELGKRVLSIFLKRGLEMSDLHMTSKDFFKALEMQQLIGLRCLDCGFLAVPQRRICPNCLSKNTEQMVFSGKGKLAAFTIIYVPSLMMSEAGYNAKNPYCVGIVALQEGPKIAAQILEMDLSLPENIVIGTPVTISTTTRKVGEQEKTYLAFKPM